MISFFNGLQLHISCTRTKLKSKARLQVNSSLMSHLTAVACESTPVSSSSVSEPCTAVNEATESHTEKQSIDTQLLTIVGDYVLVKCGELEGNTLPACIIRKEPLALRYFVHGPVGLYMANEDEFVILHKDILHKLQDPTPVQCGSRLYFKFDNTATINI